MTYFSTHSGGGLDRPRRPRGNRHAAYVTCDLGYEIATLHAYPTNTGPSWLQWVVRDLGDAFPGIESIPGVSGGEACIVRTRIPVWVLVQARRLGTSEAELLKAYPTLRAEDLTNTWAYYRAHREEIEQQISDNEAA